MDPDNQSGVPQSKIHPKFLHSNSTSHTWVFSAIAELIDNAYDPDVKAAVLLIDKVDINNKPCLVLMDNGTGMDYDKLHNMLSFGFCEKDIYENNETYKPIGKYGNGFKSGAMRLGKDALVFTRCKDSTSIGFLSQTFLDATKADTVLVPLIKYKLPGLIRDNTEGTRICLKQILKYSIFKTEDALKKELKALESSVTGTKIIIYNLKTIQDVTLELDFASDPKDIRCPETHQQDSDNPDDRPIASVASEYKRSLREYCRILFHHPRMKIILRGTNVRSKIVAKCLYQTAQDKYKPTWLDKPVVITFGFSCERECGEDYGMMLYHRNRLIKAYEKVGYQKQANEKGVGVVGVADVSFLKATHNKQDFEKDEKYISVMKALADKLNNYWNEIKPEESDTLSPEAYPDWTWAQCDLCLKWRRLPPGTRPEDLPERWFCRSNTDSTHNRCELPQEKLDENGHYIKKNKQQKRNKKTQKKDKSPKKTNAEITVRAVREVRYSLRGLPSDNLNELSAKRKRSINTDSTDDDSDETIPSTSKKSLRSSRSETEANKVHNKKQKTSPLDKHYDYVNDEPKTTSEKTRKLNRSNSESSLESIPCDLVGKSNYQEGKSGSSSCSVYMASDLSEENIDNDLYSHANVEANTMSSSEISPLVNESPKPSTSFVPTESLHRDADKTGSEVSQNSFDVDEKIDDKESTENETQTTKTESEEIRNLKTELALQKIKVKQLEERLDKLSGNVRKLIRLTSTEEYYDSNLDNVEDAIEDIIRKIVNENGELP